MGHGYHDHGDGTVSKGGLMWMRCLPGQTWDGRAAQGEALKFSWEEALALRYSFAGHDDWRVPSIEELHTLVQCNEGQRPLLFDADGRVRMVDGTRQDGGCMGGAIQAPTIDTQAFPGANDGWYWSSTPYTMRENYAWGLVFRFGFVFADDKALKMDLRLVRGPSTTRPTRAA